MTEEIAARGHLDIHRPQVPMPVTLGALRRARAAGLLTVCNTAPAPVWNGSALAYPATIVRYGSSVAAW